MNLYNTIFGDESFLGQKKTNNRDRASSFDLVLFQINEEWDEGVGFDYSKTEYDFTTGNDLYSTRPSNWFIKNNSVDGEWDYPGIYDGTSGYTVISTIHFDNGNENINVDITSTINNIIDGGTNYGFGLAFIPHYESLSLIDDLSVSFFTKYTQTFYEPYIESVFDDTIEDNRVNFIGGIEQNLYLYVTKGKNPYNLDSLPTVELYDSSNNIITGSTISAITKVKKGVYRVGITIDTNVNTCNGQYFYYDVWKNIIIDGFTVSDITQKFVPQPYTSNYTIGGVVSDTNRYISQFSGIKQNEKIKRGEKRKISVKFKSINQSKQDVFNDVYYRIYITEGRTQVDVFNWTKMDVTNENSFMLDTSFLIPREYNIEIKGITHGEELFHPNTIKFEIVSER